MTLVKITTLIDLTIKTEYDLLNKTHNKNYRDAIELGALAIISQYDPEKASELRIQKLEQELAEERQALANYKLIKQLPPSPSKSSKPDPDIEQKRIDKFNTKKEVLFKQYTTGSLDWTKNASVFWFKTANEVRDWMLPLLQED